MKNVISKIFIISTLAITSSISFAEEQYIMNIGVKSKPIITSGDKEQPIVATFQYIEKFDMSLPETGNGTYTNNDTTVRMSAANTYSKKTFPVEKSESVNEARIRFVTGSANYANGLMFRKNNGSRFLFWYNNTKLLYVYNDAGSVVKQVNVGGGGSSVMEMRYNMDTNEYQFLVNEVVKDSGIAGVPNQSYVDARVFEGSYSTSTLAILPSPQM